MATSWIDAEADEPSRRHTSGARQRTGFRRPLRIAIVMLVVANVVVWSMFRLLISGAWSPGGSATSPTRGAPSISDPRRAA